MGRMIQEGPLRVMFVEMLSVCFVCCVYTWGYFFSSSFFWFNWLIWLWNELERLIEWEKGREKFPFCTISVNAICISFWSCSFYIPFKQQFLNWANKCKRLSIGYVKRGWWLFVQFEVVVVNIVSIDVNVMLMCIIFVVLFRDSILPSPSIYHISNCFWLKIIRKLFWWYVDGVTNVCFCFQFCSVQIAWILFCHLFPNFPLAIVLIEIIGELFRWNLERVTENVYSLTRSNSWKFLGFYVCLSMVCE